MGKNIDYNKRDFNGIRTELIAYSKSNYGVEFTPASIDLLLVELISGVGDMLSYNTDKKYLETQLEYAQEKKNILAHARTLGLKIPNKKPSMTVCEFTVTVPVLGDTYNHSFAPVIKMGAQVSGAGQTFETSDDIDFNSDFSALGVPNRKILPNIDSNNVIKSYNIIKQEIVKNGITKIGRKLITEQDYRPFFTLVIPEDNVMSIEQVIQIPSLNYNETPTLSQFLEHDNRFYEVPSLVEDRVYLEDIDVVGKGRYFLISKRFLTEYTEDGFCKIIFGGGASNNDVVNNFLGSVNSGNIVQINNYLNTDTLGEIPELGKTIYYRYRVGGGANTNIGQNVLNSMGMFDMVFDDPTNVTSQLVKASLKVNNPVPALGGADTPSIEQIRRYISYNFASQNRCVTVRDYLSKLFEMHGKFGSPFRVEGREESNKIVLSILSLNNEGKLSNSSNTLLKENIAEYLMKFRSPNDYLEIEDGRIINLAFEVDLLLDRMFNRSEVNGSVIRVIKDYLDISTHSMNENIYMGDLIEKINNVAGVLNIIDIRVINKVGGVYSDNEISMIYSNPVTRQVELVDYTLFGEPTGMFEIRYPSRDIIIRNKTN